MLDKPFAVIIGIGMFVYVGAILLESTPNARLVKTCAPVRWTGNIMGSIAALTDSDKLTERISAGTDDFDYGCQFTIWRLMYGKEYANGAQAAQVERAPNFGEQGLLPPGGMAYIDPTKERGTSGRREIHVPLIEKQN